MKKRDERVNFTNEVLQGIKALKLYSWEPLLAEQLEAKRSAELSSLISHNLLLAALITVINGLPAVVMAVSFILYSVAQGDISNHLSHSLQWPRST